MKYQSLDQQRPYNRVEKMASVLEVSRGGYYAWRKRETSKRVREDDRLVAEGWLYPFVIIDLYRRRVGGWVMSKSLGTTTLLRARWMAAARRSVPEGADL